MWWNTSSGAALFAAFLLALGLTALAVTELVKRLFRLGADYGGPRRTAEAAVSARRREDRFQGSRYRRTRIRVHYTTFELADGTQVELWTSRRQYRRLPEGAAGRLTWQGSRLVKFEPAGEPR